MKKQTTNTPADAPKSEKMNFCAPIEGTLKNDILALKSAKNLANNADVLEFLLNAYKNPAGLKTELTSKQKVERFIQTELQTPTQKINTHTIKKYMLGTFDIAINNKVVAEEIIVLYAEEIKEHNAKFSDK